MTDFEEMLAWMQRYVDEEPSDHPLWNLAHLTEEEVDGLADILVTKPWREPSE